MNKLISIIIPTYNRHDILKDCLESVYNLDFENKEVIVVDDASNDGTEEMIKREFPEVIYIKKEKRTGVGSKNLGIKKSSGAYLWFLDSDSFVQNKDCLKEMIGIMEENKNIGSIGGEIIERDDVKYIRMLRFFKNAKETRLDEIGPKNLILQDVDYSPTCNCFVRRELVEKIGGFEESYFYVGEDAELGKRIRDLGFRNVIDRRTLVEHRRSNVSRTANYKLFHRNKMKFIIRNFGFFVFLLMPFIEVFNMIDGYLQLKGKSLKDIKGLNQAGGNYNKITIGLNYFFYLFYGYLWNLFLAPLTLKEKYFKSRVS